MSFKDCQGCSDCKTTLAIIPSLHREYKSHNYENLLIEDADREAYREVCTICHYSRHEIEAYEQT